MSITLKLDLLFQKNGKKYGVEFSLKGKADEQKEAAGDVKVGALISLFSIYIILSWVLVGILLKHISLTRLIYGNRNKLVDNLLLFALINEYDFNSFLAYSSSL